MTRIYLQFVVYWNLFGFVFISSISSILNTNNTVLAIVVRSLFLLYSFFVIIFSLYTGINRLKTWPLFLFFTFWSVYLIRFSVYFSLDKQHLIHELSFYLTWLLGVIFIPMLGIILIENKKKWEYIINLDILIYVMTFTMILLVLALYYQSEINIVEGYRMSLKSLNPISIGHFATSILLIAFWYIKTVGFKNKNAVIPMLVIPVAFYLLLGSGSRGPLVALMVISLLYIQFYLSDKRSFFLKLVLFFCIVFIIMNYEYIYLRLNSSGVDETMTTRVDLYWDAINGFLANPLFGSSLEIYSKSYYPHNIFLEVAMTTGFLGLIPFMILSYIGIKKSVVMLKLKLSNSYLGLLYLQYFIGALFSGAIYTNQIFWILTALIINQNFSIKQHDRLTD